MESFNVAIPTSFDEDEKLNPDNTLKIIPYLAKLGVRSFVLCGSTGEQHSLSLEEKLKLLDTLEKSNLPNEHEYLFGMASIRQVEALHLAEAISRSNKVSGVMLGFPPYICPSQPEALVYAKKLINKAEKPVLLYNNPRRTGFDLSVESIVELASMSLIAGLKEAGDPGKIQELKKQINSPLLYFMGGEAEMISKLDAGFNAVSSVWGNIYPQEVKSVLDSYRNEDRKSAVMHYEHLTRLLETEQTANPLPRIKSLLQSKGVPAGVCRAPSGNEGRILA